MHVITNENVFLRICEAEAFWDIQEHWTSHETMFTIEGRIEDIGATQLRSGHGGGRVFPGEYVHISLAHVSLFPVLSACVYSLVHKPSGVFVAVRMLLLEDRGPLPRC